MPPSMSQQYTMDRTLIFLLSPLSLSSPILTEKARLAFLRGIQVAARWTLEAMTAVLAALAVAGIAIGFASIGDGEDGFFELATRSVQAAAELFR